MAQVAMVVTFTAAPGKQSELAETLRPMIEAVKTEPGCLAYAMHVGDEESVVFYELYESQAAREAHSDNPAFGPIRPALAPLLAAPPVFANLTPIAAMGLPFT